MTKCGYFGGIALLDRLVLRLPGLFNPDTGQWFVRQRRREANLATEQGHRDMHRRLSTKIIKF